MFRMTGGRSPSSAGADALSRRGAVSTIPDLITFLEPCVGISVGIESSAEMVAKHPTAVTATRSAPMISLGLRTEFQLTTAMVSRKIAITVEFTPGFGELATTLS